MIINKINERRGCMKIKLLSWNTQLYEYGNLEGKSIDEGIILYNEIKDKVSERFQNLKEKEKVIIILQEIPYKIKINWKWELHSIFKQFQKDFSKNDYDIIYLADTDEGKRFHIKMTVVIATKGTISEAKPISNIFVPFKIKGCNTNVLALHSHNAFEVRQWLDSNHDFKPNLMIGDFNAGNYKKQSNDNSFFANRQDYLLLLEGYLDVCQGINTTKYKTQIDHVLIENNADVPKYKYEKVRIDSSVNISDHYPIYCDILVGPF